MRAREFWGTVLSLSGLIVPLSGCDEPIKEPQLIENSRVLGARIEAAGEPGRAELAPGETATVRWWVADPRPLRPLTWVFGVCPAEAATSGLPQCGGPIFFETVSPEPEEGAPEFTFTVLSASELSGFRRLVILGVICAEGTLTVAGSPWQAECSGPNAERSLVSLYVKLSVGGEPNHNPELGNAEVLWDGVPWPEPSDSILESLDCQALPEEVPRVRAASAGHLLQITVAAADREPLVAASELDPTQETVGLYHFVTAGELERPYSILDPGAPDLVEVGWKAPASVPAEGLLVRFYLVERDFRGGEDFEARAVCVVP
jgi:hypothetical protein